MTLLTFDDALKKAQGKKHLLLGNGFSIALDHTIFSYGSLLENADFSDIPTGPKLFKALETSDFESVIRRLNDLAKIIHLYPEGSSIREQITEDAKRIKQICPDPL